MRKSKAKLEEKVLAGVDESTMKSANDGTESDATNTESSDDDGEEDVLHVNALQPASDNDDATDSSDEEVRRDMQLSESELLTQDLRNTIGNVPVRWYDDFDHVGYDSTGQKIAKSAPTNKSEIDEFLAKMEDPDYWRKVKDRQLGGEIRLTDEQIATINNVQRGRYPAIGFNPYEPYMDYFSSEVMQMPITNRPEHKRSFIPSVLDAKKVSRLVYAIKMGWIKPHQLHPAKPSDRDDDDHENLATYDLWAENEQTSSKSSLDRLRMHIPAPKLPLPTHVESYNPPAEFLFTDDERRQWEETEAEERAQNFVPAKFDCLRHVPGYTRLVNERYERCMDLYLAPRQRKMKLNVSSPNDLLPSLPKPQDLQPFPSKLSLTMRGHLSAVQGMCIEPVHGEHIATCAHDGLVIIWNIAVGIAVHTIDISLILARWHAANENDCALNTPNVARLTSIDWSAKHALLTVSTGNQVLFLNARVGGASHISSTDKFIDHLLPIEKADDGAVAAWSSNMKWNARFAKLKSDITQVVWHAHGDYLASVSAGAGAHAVVLHQLSKVKSQAPFSKKKGDVQRVEFHRTKPWLFVCTKEHVSVYDLAKQVLVKKVQTNCRSINSICVHPTSDNLLVGSADSRVSWLDLDLSARPYKTLKYHKSGVRTVTFHQHLPLFASAGDDGNVLVCHANVYNDLTTNALIVPVKSLPVGASQVTQCCFHPRLPWLLAACTDHTVRLFVY